MAVTAGLTAALKKVVLELEDDLRSRVEGQPEVNDRWREEHAQAVAKERTGMSWQEWRDDRVTMAAVAWVLTTVFVRFCEDNRLLAPVWIAGPPERRQEALDAELDYFRRHPEDTYREWLMQAVRHLESVKATRELVESRSSLWTVSPSGPAVKRLFDFWRATTDAGQLIHDFTDPELSTRFLGDLYQDLSDYAKKTYALLQTPVFVEEFILDQTMEPALAERPLEGFKLIDPACGSGHFLLGAFARLNDRWAQQAPGLEVRARVERALEAVHGVDLNPFAVAIAKFRLMVAALQACGERSLEQAPNFHFNLAVGDSLLHGGHQLSLQFDGFDADAQISGFAYETEDLALLKEILEPGRYDVVVANPPYITVKDKKLNQRYRELYQTCKGTYALTVPFMERIFELAKRPAGDQPAGWTGQITSNSFMKRRFGARLIEKFLPSVDLVAVVDIEGAWIPGHNMDGTPTVIMFGRNQPPSSSNVKVVTGKGRRESRSVGNGGGGALWRSVIQNFDHVGFENDWIEVAHWKRVRLSGHPWSLAAGGADQVLSVLNSADRKLDQLALRIGMYGDSHAEDVFAAPEGAFARLGVDPTSVAPAITGDYIRDWQYFTNGELYLGLPPGSTGPAPPADTKAFWPWRTTLWSRASFSGGTYKTDGWHWLCWHQTSVVDRANVRIAFSKIAAQNNFALIERGAVEKPSALRVELRKGVRPHSLLGVLNSSCASFWIKAVSQPKGGAADMAFLRTFEISSTTLKDLPVPGDADPEIAQRLASLGAEVARLSRYPAESGGNGEEISEYSLRYENLLQEMTALQEELDWQCYAEFGLTAEAAVYPTLQPPRIGPGQRAFEMVLAAQGGKEASDWFGLAQTAPNAEPPSEWPESYRSLVRERMRIIQTDSRVRALELPQYKRRWSRDLGNQIARSGLSRWLLDRLERRGFWFDAQGRPAARSVAQLADLVSRDADLVSVLELWSGRKDQSVTQQLSALLDDESVPFLAAYRLKDSGLRKREAWEETWDLQRREDAGEEVGDIPVPPKYTSADFRKTSWWQHRGKLDVPKERFILYPDAGRETDPTELLGWAGWDHAQKALALAMVVGDREQEGWSEDRLVPLVAGLAELQPWVRQWHDEVDETYGLNLADYCEEQLRDRALQVGKTMHELKDWRPAPATRGRRARS